MFEGAKADDKLSEGASHIAIRHASLIHENITDRLCRPNAAKIVKLSWSLSRYDLVDLFLKLQRVMTFYIRIIAAEFVYQEVHIVRVQKLSHAPKITYEHSYLKHYKCDTKVLRISTSLCKYLIWVIQIFYQ